MIGYALVISLDELLRLVIVLEQAESLCRAEGFDVIANDLREKAEHYDGKIALLQAALRDPAPRP